MTYTTPTPNENQYACELCQDTEQVEIADSEGLPSGYYKPCLCADDEPIDYDI